jgi:hypothetical protein
MSAAISCSRKIQEFGKSQKISSSGFVGSLHMMLDKFN